MERDGAHRGFPVTSRRTALGLALGAVGAVSTAGCGPEPVRGYTVEKWRSERGQNFMIAHRGGGDVVPEHTLEAYQAALGWGAKALEISVVGTSDGVLICQHDLDYNRTTNLRGPVVTQTSSVLVDARVTVPRLGPRWNGDNAPPVARLEEVLRKIGDRAVLIIEAKDDSVFPGVQRAIADRGLEKSVIVKLHQDTQRIGEAHKLGFPVFCYFGTVREMTPDRITAVAAQLDPARDCLVVPAYSDDGLIPDELLALATATKVPVWVHPVHRRWEVAHFFARGVQALVASSYGYLASTVKPLTTADWESGALHPGEMTKQPDSTNYGLEWPEPGVIRLAVQERQAFLTLGHLSPLATPQGPYVIDLELRVDTAPKDPFSNLSLAFGHADDLYYEHRQGARGGYHAMIRMTGEIDLRRHDVGSDEGEPLGKPVPGPKLVKGTWVPLRVEVTPTRLTFTRMDTGASISGEDSTHRGAYLHVGRSALDGAISLRRLQIRQTPDSTRT